MNRGEKLENRELQVMGDAGGTPPLPLSGKPFHVRRQQ